MKYQHVVSYIARAVWSIDSTKMDDILDVIAHRAAGHTFTPEEIKARIGGEAEQPVASRRGAVAVLPLRGVIAHRMGTMAESSGGMSAERFTAMVRAAAADESVGSIVLDVDSPGGTINGVAEAAEAVYQARQSKPVIAVANGMMASAAYWIASQASEIVAVPGLLDRSIGSIGVFTVHQDLSAHLEKEGIKVSIIKAGKHKAEANPFEPLSDELRADIQASVDEAYGHFVKAVARGRGVSVADVRGGFGEGKALNAKDAKAAGMVDRIASFDDTLARALGGKRGNAGAYKAMGASDELAEALAQSDEDMAVVRSRIAAELAAKTEAAILGTPARMKDMAIDAMNAEHEDRERRFRIL